MFKEAQSEVRNVIATLGAISFHPVIENHKFFYADFHCTRILAHKELLCTVKRSFCALVNAVKEVKTLFKTHRWKIVLINVYRINRD